MEIRLQKGYPKVGNMEFSYQVQNFVMQSADFPRLRRLEPTGRADTTERRNLKAKVARAVGNLPSNTVQKLNAAASQLHECRSKHQENGCGAWRRRMQHSDAACFRWLGTRHHSRVRASSLRTFSSMSLSAVTMRILKSFMTSGCKFGNGARALQCIMRLWTRLTIVSLPYAIPGVSLMQRMSTKLLASLKEKPQESTAG